MVRQVSLVEKTLVLGMSISRLQLCANVTDRASAECVNLSYPIPSRITSLFSKRCKGPDHHRTVKNAANGCSTYRITGNPNINKWRRKCPNNSSFSQSMCSSPKLYQYSAAQNKRPKWKILVVKSGITMLRVIAIAYGQANRYLWKKSSSIILVILVLRCTNCR